VAQNTPAKGHVFAKTGTGIQPNATKDGLFLTTKALAGYIQAQNGRWYAFMIAVNNAPMESIEVVFAINDDVGRVAASLYDVL